MLLFHSSLSSRESLKDGLKSSYKLGTTMLINTTLEKAGYKEITEIRNNAVFFLGKNIRRGKTMVAVDIRDLDLDKLYVADEVISNKIYALAKIGRDTVPHCKAYAEKFLTYREYINNDVFLKRPEFIYTGDVKYESLNFIESVALTEDELTTMNKKIYLSSNMEEYFEAQ